MPRWAHDVEDRRVQIIDAAMKVFTQKGIARTTNKDIAREAGITTGLIYYYFENKDALLQAVLDTRTSLKLVNQITPEMLKQPPEVFFPLIIQQVIPYLEDPQVIGVLRVVITEIPNSTNIRKIASKFMQRILKVMERYLKTQSEMGNLPADLDYAMVPQVIAASTVGFIVRRYLIQDDVINRISNEEAAQAITRLVLNGVLPR